MSLCAVQLHNSCNIADSVYLSFYNGWRVPLARLISHISSIGSLLMLYYIGSEEKHDAFSSLALYTWFPPATVLRIGHRPSDRS